MNTVNINDEDFVKTKAYQDFLVSNPSNGFLKVRAFAANQAIPISGLKVVVTKNIGNNNVVFFEGYTNESGVIEKISLPAPKLDLNNLDIPKSASYEIATTYLKDNTSELYKVNIYENIYVIQNISIVPNMNLEIGGF